MNLSLPLLPPWLVTLITSKVGGTVIASVLFVAGVIALRRRRVSKTPSGGGARAQKAVHFSTSAVEVGREKTVPKQSSPASPMELSTAEPEADAQA